MTAAESGNLSRSNSFSFPGLRISRGSEEASFAATQPISPNVAQAKSPTSAQHDHGLGALPHCHFPWLGGNDSHRSLPLLRSQCRRERSPGCEGESVGENGSAVNNCVYQVKIAGEATDGSMYDTI
ncbi:hypothetical protein VTK56DRAFT_10076 [Thermocarpiscus australiensis]